MKGINDPLHLRLLIFSVLCLSPTFENKRLKINFDKKENMLICVAWNLDTFNEPTLTALLLSCGRVCVISTMFERMMITRPYEALLHGFVEYSILIGQLQHLMVLADRCYE